jgi:choline dehydrogenase
MRKEVPPYCPLRKFILTVTIKIQLDGNRQPSIPHWRYQNAHKPLVDCLPTFSSCKQERQNAIEIMKDVAEQFEYVVVGGGSAGMALAARLSEERRKTLLIEAGRTKNSLFNFWIIDMPAAYGYGFMNPSINWMYRGEPEPGLKNRTMYQPRGKVLGGSSCINGMGWLRPHPGVFDRWTERGAAGWSFDDVLPYFKKLETWTGKPSDLRGTEGPIHVTNGPLECPYYGAFFLAGSQAGYGYTEDINAEVREGFGQFQMNVEDGVRASTAYSYQKHVVDKAWLTIEGCAHATRVMTSNGKATAVEYLKKGKLRRVEATKEIILSAGTFNTPQILMLSGIGPEDELRKHGIDLQLAAPGVGQNLQDHPIIYPKYLSRHADSPIKYQRLDRKARVGAQWLLSRGGVGTTNYMEAIALLRSDSSVPYPDIEFQFCPLVIDHSVGGALDNIHGWSNSCGPVLIESTGWVKLQSNDPMSAPRILCNFMATDHDIHLMHKAFEVNREIMSRPAFKPFLKDELEPGFKVQSRSEIHEYLVSRVQGDYHPVGTCKIGDDDDPMAVVDSELRVRGIDGLRIADASIMPVITNANTNSTSIMIGERAADLMLGRTAPV